MRFYQKWEAHSLEKGRDAWFSAEVPGNLQKDYAAANGFPDCQYADNVKLFLPLEGDTWEYRTVLSYEREAGERVFFVSRGIQYRYEIALNGEVLYAYEGMFRTAEVELTGRLTGNDVLTVRIFPHPKRVGAFPGTRDEADDSCNPPVYYGWDWNPRLLISGIWDETYVETRGEGYISGCEVLCSLDEDLKNGTVTCAFESSLPAEIMLFDAEGQAVYRGRDKTFTVPSPHLWWCNGQGEPYLYRWVISNGQDTREGHIGFRRIRLVRNKGANGPKGFPKGPYEDPITLELNGRRIFCKGSNWVNPELFWGGIDAGRYEELILLAKNCHMNIFRMWGGAGVPKESFYNICDREGILIWQEFMLACNNYRDTPHYMSVLESEASAIIRKFRSHPALAFWCGGNELFNSWSGMDSQSHPLRLLNKLCLELDYDRPFLYTSPVFGMSHGGYTFYAQNQNGDVLSEFQHARSTAYTEFGVPSIAPVETLKEIIPEDELFPPRPTPAWLTHHGFRAWTQETWCCLDTYRRYFGEPASLEELTERESWMQCEGYRGAFEEMRRQWPYCSMAVNWCFNEPWKTAAGNNLISYPAKPRPSYSYVREAMRPTLFSAKVAKFDWHEGEVFEAELWMLNDAPNPASGNVHVSAVIGGTRIDLVDWRASAGPCENFRGPTVRFILPHEAGSDRITLELSSPDGYGSEYSFLYIPKAEKPRISAPKQLNA